MPRAARHLSDTWPQCVSMHLKITTTIARQNRIVARRRGMADFAERIGHLSNGCACSWSLRDRIEQLEIVEQNTVY
jgi:hypothetical protein